MENFEAKFYTCDLTFISLFWLDFINAGIHGNNDVVNF